MPRIIDSHSHFMPPQVAQHTAFFKQFWSDSDHQLRLMDQYGIERSVLLYPTSDAHLNMGGWSKLCAAYNPEIAALVKRHPDRFIGAGILPVDSPGLIREELNRINDLGLRMISLASSYERKYLDDEVFTPIFEFAQRRRIAIHVHPQIMQPIGEERVSDPLLTPVLEYVFDVSMTIGKMMMGNVFLRFPEIKFIFAHFGGVLPIVKDRFDTTYMMLRKREFVKDLGKNPSQYFRNLYFDISGSKSPGVLQAMLEVVDPSHILWGSDFPANQNFSEPISVVERLNLTAEDKNKIFVKNLLDIIEI